MTGRAGGLNGACEPSLGGRPALISPAPLCRTPQPRSDAGAGTCPAAPRDPHGQPPCPQGVRAVPSVAQLSLGAGEDMVDMVGTGRCSPGEMWCCVHADGVGMGLKICGVTLGTLHLCNRGGSLGGTEPTVPQPSSSSSGLPRTHHTSETNPWGGDTMAAGLWGHDWP